MAPTALEVRELTLSDRKCCFAMVLLSHVKGVMKRGSYVRAAEILGVSARRVSNLWGATCANMLVYLEDQDDVEGMAQYLDWELPLTMYPDHVFASGKVGHCGKKKQFNRDELKRKTLLLPLNQRSTYRSHAAQLGISVQTCYKWCLEPRQ
jgi:hypothetical protein